MHLPPAETGRWIKTDPCGVALVFLGMDQNGSISFLQGALAMLSHMDDADDISCPLRVGCCLAPVCRAQNCHFLDMFSRYVAAISQAL